MKKLGTVSILILTAALLIASMVGCASGNAAAIGIEVATPPQKTQYTLGEEVSFDGLIVKVKYDDGSYSEAINVNSLTIQTPDTTTVGSKNVTVKYGIDGQEYEVSFAITVTAPVHQHTYATEWSSDESYHWHAATCTHTDEASARAEHVWNEGEVTTSPTETTAGVKTFTCTTCNKTKTETVPVVVHAHNFTKVDAKSATCENVGNIEFYTCTGCGKSYTDANGETEIAVADTIIAKTAHTYATEWSSDESYHWHAATCEHADNKSGYAAHQFTSSVTTEPTCTADGVRTYRCIDCAYSYTQAESKKEHQYYNVIFYNETQHYRQCMFCDECTDYANHVYDDGTETLKATYFSYGFTAYHCQQCGYYYEERVDMKVISVTPARSDFYLYDNDTAVTYTVVTPVECNRVDLSMLYLRSQYKSMSLEQLNQAKEEAYNILSFYGSKNKQTFTPTDSEVSVVDADGERIWTINCDFGFTGVGEVCAEAYTGEQVVPFSIAACSVNILYPEHNVIDEFDSVIDAIFRLNKDETYYFVCDLSKTSIGSADMDMSNFRSLVNVRFDDLLKTDSSMKAVQDLGLSSGDYWTNAQEDPMRMCGNFFTAFSQYMQIMSCSDTELLEDTEFIICSNQFVPETNRTTVLCAIRLRNEDPLFADTPADSRGTLVSPSIRAYFCEKLGVTINATDFPSAAAVQIKMREAIAAMNLDTNATDLEKMKAVVAWMYENGKSEKHILPQGYNENYTPLQKSIYVKTSYGLLNNHFGDCMGWSDTFYLLCNLVGVKCVTFDCSATAGGENNSEDFAPNHRINIVWIDGEGYFCDVYWGALGSAYTQPMFTYIGLTAQEAANYYSWRSSKGMPKNIAETGLDLGDVCAQHVGGTATCTNKAVCTACGSEYGSALGHNYGEYVDNGDGTHSRTCTRDNEHVETASHNLVNKVCADCDYVDFPNMTYTAMGDSITWGYLPFSGEKMTTPYPESVGTLLELEDALNCGISGLTLTHNEDLAYMATYYLQFSATDILSVLGGVNDYRLNKLLGTIDDTEDTTIYGALNTLAAGLKEKYPNAFIFFMTPLKMRGWEADNEQGYNLEDVATAVKQVADKYNIPVLDLFADGQFELEMSTPESDGVHPSQEFVQQYLAPQIAQFIQDNYLTD